MNLSEADIKLAVEERLTYAQNQGQLMFLRLNSGEALVKKGDKFYKIQLCPSGTADFIVIQSEPTVNIFPRVTFLEIKSSKGSQSMEQEDFQVMVQWLSCRYAVVRDAEELEGILEFKEL